MIFSFIVGWSIVMVLGVLSFWCIIGVTSFNEGIVVRWVWKLVGRAGRGFGGLSLCLF